MGGSGSGRPRTKLPMDDDYDKPKRKRRTTERVLAHTKRLVKEHAEYIKQKKKNNTNTTTTPTTPITTYITTTTQNQNKNNDDDFPRRADYGHICTYIENDARRKDLFGLQTRQQQQHKPLNTTPSKTQEQAFDEFATWLNNRHNTATTTDDESEPPLNLDGRQLQQRWLTYKGKYLAVKRMELDSQWKQGGRGGALRLTAQDRNNGIGSVAEKLDALCPFYFRLDAIFGGWTRRELRGDKDEDVGDGGDGGGGVASSMEPEEGEDGNEDGGDGEGGNGEGVVEPSSMEPENNVDDEDLDEDLDSESPSRGRRRLRSSARKKDVKKYVEEDSDDDEEEDDEDGGGDSSRKKPKIGTIATALASASTKTSTASAPTSGPPTAADLPVLPTTSDYLRSVRSARTTTTTPNPTSTSTSTTPNPRGTNPSKTIPPNPTGDTALFHEILAFEREKYRHQRQDRAVAIQRAADERAEKKMIVDEMLKRSESLTDITKFLEVMYR